MLLASTAGGLAGALIASGAVVLTATAIANPNTAQNVGFVIPISRAKPTIDRLRGGE